MIITIILIIFFVVLLKDKIVIATPENIGKIGEEKIEKQLESIKIENDEYILKNVYIPINENKTTEIDLIYITKQGLIIIESKNYNGWIFGNRNQKYWTISYSSNTKKRLYNPIWQNENHIKHLKKYLKKEIKTHSIIVFGNNAEIKVLRNKKETDYIINTREIKGVINHIKQTEKKEITEIEIKEIYNKLKPLTNRTKEEIEAHKRRVQNEIQNKRNDKEIRIDTKRNCRKNENTTSNIIEMDQWRKKSKT